MKRIGIIGGGQLGLMIAQEAQAMGHHTTCLDPSEDAPAFAVCDEGIVGEYCDVAALSELCESVDVVTYEFENIPGDVLIPLCEKYNIPQGYKPLFDSQDRLREKDNAKAHGLTLPQYYAVDDESSLREAVEKMGLPAVLKTRTLGYDGHGQAVLRCEDDIQAAVKMLSVPCILEEFVNFDFEVSVVSVASRDKAIAFPVGENIHTGGILDLSIVPAPKMSEELRARALEQSKRFMQECGYEGILAIEYFIKGDQILFNEMAPRPHNSGHYTQDGTTTNQFRELVRYLVGEPLQEPELIAPTVMKNILGQDMQSAESIASEQTKGANVHIYGKSESRPKRKMAHINFVGMTHEQFCQEWAERFV